MKENIKTFLILIVVGFISRIIPHPWNFTGMTAMALFSGILFKENKLLIFSPPLTLFLSDLVLGLHSTMIYTYAGFILVSLMSLVIFYNSSPKKTVSYGLCVASSLLGSIIFFIVSNSGFWLTTGVYERSFLGYTECLVAGLPFLDNLILGDLFFTTLYALSFSKLTSLKVSLIRR